MAGADLGTAWLNVVPSFQGMKQKVASERREHQRRHLLMGQASWF